MTPVHITPELLDRYLAGEATAEERGLVDRWIAADAARADLVSALGRGEAPDTEGWLARVNARRAAEAVATRDGLRVLDVAGARHRVASRGHAAMGHVRRLWPWAAAVAVAAAALVVVRNHDGTRPSAPSPMRTYATGTGQLAHIVLSDGTQITLAPRTTLAVSRFDGAHRTVELRGEAYFDVHRVADAPFIVRAGGVQAQVLGTSFVVRRYADDRDAQVAVLSGKVGVAAPRRASAGATETVVTAGTMAVVSDSTTITTAMADTTPSPYTGWMNGVVVFRKAPAADVLAAITRWYGYQIQLTDSTLATRNLTVALSTQSSADALSSLKLVLGVDIAFEGNRLILTPRRSPRLSGREREVRPASQPQREVGR